MISDARFTTIAVIVALAGSLGAGYAASQTASHALASPDSFAGIADPQKRSAAIFTELGKVLTHPRCTNCHPAGDSPRQGDTPRLHQPPVARGADGHGLETMRCQACHLKANFEPGRVPGHPEWHLAPREMAWEGKTVGEICEQIRDPARNGGRKVDELIDHIGKDTLVGWAWKPGFGRSPAPGTQEQAGALVEAWVKTGAACPAP
ncbi:Isoquinoline 1-oxidoreductase subunit [Bradyrhizobium sp.]|uniref:Isoquinoline 1-oxidoreductase subunit n=1 Tax=Bradyrhizobium sp. TaxID=376 RepID=UPI0039E34955